MTLIGFKEYNLESLVEATHQLHETLQRYSEDDCKAETDRRNEESQRSRLNLINYNTASYVFNSFLSPTQQHGGGGCVLLSTKPPRG